MLAKRLSTMKPLNPKLNNNLSNRDSTTLFPNFQPLLHRSLFLTNLAYKNKKFHEEYIEEHIEDVEFYSCSFTDYTNEDFEGGAMFLTVNASFNKCLFQNCRAKEGSSFASYAPLTLKANSFLEMKAQRNAAFLAGTEATLKLDINTFFSCTSESNFGCFSKYKGKGHEAIRSNISTIKFGSHIGTFEFGEGEASVAFMTVTLVSTESGGNSGIGFWSMTQFTLDSSVFTKSRAEKAKEKTSSAVWIDGGKTNGSISLCSFVDNHIPQSGGVIFFNDFNTVAVMDCCFDVEKEKAVGSYKPVQMEGNKFSTQCIVETTPVEIDGFAVSNLMLIAPAIVVVAVIIERKNIARLLCTSKRKSVE